MTASIHEGDVVLKEAQKAPSNNNAIVTKPVSTPTSAMASGEHYPTTTEEARQHVSMFLENSRRLGNNIHEIPTFDSRELLLGRWLGKGGFSDVEELRGILHIPSSLRKKTSSQNSTSIYGSTAGNEIKSSDPESSQSSSSNSSRPTNDDDEQDGVPGPAELGYESPHDVSESASPVDDCTERRFSASSCAPPPGNEAGRKFLKENCLRDTGEARYAIKRLRKEIVNDPQLYPSGAMDLAVEALFLADLSHPNIIKLRAIATCDPFARTQNDFYFLVMDRLQGTLLDRMTRWKERKRKLKTLVGRISDVGGRKKQLLLDERLAAAFDLSAAMAYLKQNRILHRDIKPENLGFDIVSIGIRIVG
jgi:serine/threonine protein kinase